MSTTTWLCVTGQMRLSPSSRDPRFDPARHTIAQGPGAIPLLWMALFRPGDLKRQAVRPIDGGPEDSAYALAPIASVDRAVIQLKAAVPALDAIYGARWGSLAELAGMLARAIQGGGQPYVTIELDEIEATQDAPAFRERMRRVLRYFDAPDRETGLEGIASELSALCGVGDELDKAHVVGARHERKVPWESGQ